MHKVFIDGRAGTTGLRLAGRLAERPDIELIDIDETLRKNMDERLSRIAEADMAFLCLPDDGAREIIAAVDAAAEKAGPDSPFSACCIIDCSTAHRTAPGWIYGLPELINSKDSTYADFYAIIRGERMSGNAVWQKKDLRIANPGCHATGFIMAVRPLVEAGILDPQAAICFHSLTGYSGGGKPMIAEYEAHQEGDHAGFFSSGKAREAVTREAHFKIREHGAVSSNAASWKKDLRAPRQYAFAQEHKHLPEMHKYSGLVQAPVFAPIVCDYYCGILVSVPLPRDALRKGASPEAVREALAAFYSGCPLVKVRGAGYEFSGPAGAGYLSADAFAGRDDIEIFVTGKDDRIEIVSRYDNLGKGASGAAVQNMNLILGLPGETGLVTGD